MKRFCILDFETRSEVDIKKTGAYVYASHPSTTVMCAAWRMGTREELRGQIENNEPPLWWSPVLKDSPTSFDLIDDLYSADIVVAHNALFEQVISTFCLGVSLPPERWLCTASLAAACALPRNLEGACAALKLPIQKDMEGRRLMLKFCKPRKPTKTNQDKWHDGADGFRRIVEYCKTDVDAETLLFLKLPPLSPTERKIWLLDQKINLRGFNTDQKLVNTALKLIDEETKAMDERTQVITKGEIRSTTQRDRLLKYLKHWHDLELPDLTAKVVADTLKDGQTIDDEAVELLQIRQAVSKTSTKKFEAFKNRACLDGRVRDMLVYHAASTGRWGGAGVQPQNFPRGSIADTALASQFIHAGDLELLRLLYGQPMDVFSSCLRSVIIASEGKELFCADYAAIEARALFWTAGHTEGVKAFAEDMPIYEIMAQLIYRVKHLEDVTKDQRFVGKQTILGAGYGMGWKKFVDQCEKFGVQIAPDVAKLAIDTYRETHHPVPALWRALEKAAIMATLHPGNVFRTDKTKWWTDRGFLWCELPSKRKLAFYGPGIKHVDTPWGEKRPALYHWGVDGISKKWVYAGTYGGKLTENVVSAIARDLMAEAMLRLEAQGYGIVLSVHDELLAERDRGTGRLDEFEKLMATVPPWACGLPVKVSGWTGPRYKK